MKNQALFSSKDKSKKLKCRLLQFMFGALRVNSSLNFERTLSSMDANRKSQKLFLFKKNRNGWRHIFSLNNCCTTVNF